MPSRRPAMLALLGSPGLVQGGYLDPSTTYAWWCAVERGGEKRGTPP